MILEEALKDGGGLSPHDAALALLAFLSSELPAGGIAAEKRLVALFPLIVDRALGEWNKPPSSPGGSPSPSPSPNGSTFSPVRNGEGDEQRQSHLHEVGGWLSMPNAPISPQRNVGSQQRNPSVSRSIDQDPIVRLLRAPKPNDFQSTSLIEILVSESIANHRPAIRFRFPIGALNAFPPLVDDWKTFFASELERENVKMKSSRGGFGSFPNPATDVKTRSTGKENASRLLHLIQVKPSQQSELINHYKTLQPTGSRQLGAQRFASPPRANMSMPASGNTAHEPCLTLSMLEEFLILFLRFPMANGGLYWKEQRREMYRTRTSRAANTPYGQRVYSYLFSTYVQYFVKHGITYQNETIDVGVDCFDRAVTIDEKELGGNDSNCSGELFLRLVIEFWLEGLNKALTTNQSIQRFRNVRSSSSSNVAQPTMSDALELSKPLEYPSTPPPQPLQSSIISLVRHLISDPSLRNLIEKASGLVQTRQVKEREGVSVGNSEMAWCLTPALTAMQPSLLNYIRQGLSCGPIHDRSSSFYTALDTWLAYLEPWNYKRSQGSGSSMGNISSRLRNVAASKSNHPVERRPVLVAPKSSAPSTYSSNWEAYVCANAHFYTVPLAIFLKRARELDFTNQGNKMEYKRSFILVQRVLRVYSRKIVSTINVLLNKRADVLSTALFAKHCTNLLEFCPPLTWKLSDCQVCATNLLEEVYSQHQKRKEAMDLFDRLEEKLESVFSGIGSNEDVALGKVLDQVRSIVNLPLDYRVMPDQQSRRHSNGSRLLRLFGLGNQDITEIEDVMAPDRDSKGLLSDRGRRQIYCGSVKCNPLDVRYIGDPLLSRTKSYEIPLLVDLAIYASHYLNKRLGFVPATASGDDDLTQHIHEMELYQNTSFRINLRFLADIRFMIVPAAFYAASFVRSCVVALFG